MFIVRIIRHLVYIHDLHMFNKFESDLASQDLLLSMSCTLSSGRNPSDLTRTECCYLSCEMGVVLLSEEMKNVSVGYKCS